MSIEVRPAGIDLRTGDDVAWLERAIADTNPDLLVLGPLYKLHRMNPNEEQPARDVVWVLDGLRERYGFALLTEAHAGKATTGDGRRNMSPSGSPAPQTTPAKAAPKSSTSCPGVDPEKNATGPRNFTTRRFFRGCPRTRTTTTR
jgi:hypothetical protein